MLDTTLIHLDKSAKSSSELAAYYRLLDKSFEPPLSSYVDIDAYADKLVNNAYVAILKNKEEFIGLFAVYINDQERKTAYLSSFAIMNKYKGLGYSGYLINEMTKVAKLSGMHRIQLEVKSSYTRAINFYQKHGFKRSDEKTADNSTFYMYMTLTENND
ncbi:GNAT family N-acetyltransferase [Dysgonomonas sp. ZJ709]|uniref:GNAT family N-acetyltransferase n=1 Tax=Dysgonomonas sp. ZJ709 TaxID=2709797 RepID=UPI0013ECACE7|nr:GNAT family N-acetyltransferase [Dysgonomonas sp. ZJ709]